MPCNQQMRARTLCSVGGGFFETSPLPDDEPPVVHSLNITRGKGDFLYYELSADASDNVGVERVEFYMDDKLLGTDYSEPYLRYLAPAYLNITRAGFFEEHTVEAVVFDLSGMVIGGSVMWLPLYEVTEVHAEILTPCCSHPRPYPGCLYTDGGVVPDGTTVDIQVRAVEYELGDEIAGMPEHMGDMDPSMVGEIIPHPVRRVEFYLDGTLIGTHTTPTSAYPPAHWQDRYIYTHPWDASGLVAGDYDIEVRAIATDGTVENASCSVTVAEGVPTVMLERSVSRIGNYFEVKLTLSNPGSASARVDTITDHVVGFQAVRKNAEEYSVTTDYTTATKDCEIAIDLFTDTTDTITLSPGKLFRVVYTVVPIMYGEATDYSIGAETVTHYYDPSGLSKENRITSPCPRTSEGEWFPSFVDNAIGSSDYLIVTNPYHLMGLYDEVDANALLDKMAELATLQNGVLGYFNGYHTLKTSFEAGDQIALTGGHIFGRSGDDEIIIGDYGDDLIRVYGANEELRIVTGSQLPIAHSLDGGDAIAVGNACDEDAGGSVHDRAEIVVADGDTGGVTVYQYNYNPGSDEFTSFEFDTRYGEGDGFAVGNVELTWTEHGQEEIIVANVCDNPSVCTGEIDFHRNRLNTPSKTFMCRFRTGDKLAVGRLLDSDRERIIISHTDGDTIDIYNWVLSESYLQLEYSISHPLATDDVLTVGNLYGNAREEIVLADKDRNKILVYSYNSRTDSIRQVRNINYFLQPEDSVAVADVFPGGKEEILVTRGRTSGGHHEGDVEILSVIFGETPGDRYALDELMNEGGEWAERMCGDWTSEGYLLLVGEIEIIPAFSDTWDLTLSDRGRVDYMDRSYASSSGGVDYPELSIGRIIGDSAERLQVPIQASIDILRGDKEFDNSDAYAVSGSRRGPSGESDRIDFAANRDSIADTLRGEGFSVIEEHCPSETEFFANAANKDVILIAGHGGRTVCDVIDRDEVRDIFRPASARPLVYAASCLTGRYPGGRSLAEAFLNNGASVYIGATEVGIWPWGGRLGENYFANLEPCRTVGSALKHAKRHRLGVNTWSWDPHYNCYTCAIFHLYGDPKLEPTWLSDSAGGTASSASTMSVKRVLSSVEVSIPDYEVTSAEGDDYVEIPGGDLVMVAGKPLVPSYSVFIDYPAGYQTHEVTLTERGGLTTDTGLNIPNTIIAIAGNAVTEAPQTPEGSGSEWWPDRNFDWTVIQNPNDTTTLAINIYPFYYNNATTDVRFYKNFEFDIHYTTSEVEITEIKTDKIAYEQGQSVAADIYILSSSDKPVNVIVDATIKSGDVDVDGLPLRTLKGLNGMVSLSYQWNSTSFEPGNYIFEVALRDPNGTLLDRKTEMFRLGISSGEIASFTATPECFEIGDNININMAFNNRLVAN